MANEHADQILQYFTTLLDEEPTRRIYAILDGARNPRIYPSVINACKHYRCLYIGHQLLFLGKMPRVLAEAAPYLVQLELASPYPKWLLTRGWGDSWGIFLSSSASIDDLLRHFRRFIMVKDEKGKYLYFRYYDPRVFRLYLPTCTSKELDIVFGSVSEYFAEAEKGEALISYSRNDESIDARSILKFAPAA